MKNLLRTALLVVMCVLLSLSTSDLQAENKGELNKSQGDWGLFLMMLQDIADASKLEKEPKPQITPTPTPFKFPHSVPDSYEDLEKILKKLKDLMKDWPWKKVIELYDLDGDGTLSPDEIKRFFQDRVPCIPLILSCEERDKIIDKLLCYFLKKAEPGCNLDGIEISPDSIEIWLGDWLHSVEAQIEFFCGNDGYHDPVRCEYFKNLKKLIEEIRDRFREGVPCPPPVDGCNCGCALDCPCRR